MSLTPPFINLVQTLLGDPETYHDFEMSDEGKIAYGQAEITVFPDGLYLVDWLDCEFCDNAHVSCREREFRTTHAGEALEKAMMEGGL